MSFQPGSDDWRERVEDVFTRQTIMGTLGARLARVEPGHVEIELPHDERFTQQHGFLHAGVVTAVVDSACGAAALSLMPAGAGVLSIEMKTSLMSPADGQSFRAVGRVEKPGRTVMFCAGELFANKDGTEKRIASLTATMIVAHGRS